MLKNYGSHQIEWEAVVVGCHSSAILSEMQVVDFLGHI